MLAVQTITRLHGIQSAFSSGIEERNKPKTTMSAETARGMTEVASGPKSAFSSARNMPAYIFVSTRAV
jgi:hypothetical protein